MLERGRRPKEFSSMPPPQIKSIQQNPWLPVRKIYSQSEIRPRKNIARSVIFNNPISYSSRSNLFERPKDEPKQNSETSARIFKKILKSIQEYTQNTTLHGLKYVGADELHPIERLFWVIAFVSGILSAAYFITVLFKRWEENPMIISLSPTATLLSAIPFPAITICNMNGATKKVVETITRNKKNDSQMKFERQMLGELCGEQIYDSVTSSEIVDANWSTIQKFMIKVSQPCQKMIVSCKWRSEFLSCNDLFNPELTDEGMCCSFNKVERSFIYRNPKQFQGLNYTFPYPGIDWTPENGYPEEAPENANPWRAFAPGMSMGLTIVLDADLLDYYCSSTAGAGFKLLLHNPIETPKISDFAYFLTPGYETRVEIVPTISTSTNSLFSIPQAKRQCIFSNERELRFYRTYTQRNCELECQSNFTLDRCKCVPFYLPKDNKTRVCGTKDNKCVIRAREILENQLKESNSSTDAKFGNMKNCSCLPSCVQIRYSKQTSMSKLLDVFKVKSDYLNGKDPAYFKENMAVVHFFFRENSFTGFEKGEIFGFTDFLSNTGGLLGLFLGFSFMSAAEIVYFFSLRIFCSRRRKQQPLPRQDESHLPDFPFSR